MPATDVSINVQNTNKNLNFVLLFSPLMNLSCTTMKIIAAIRDMIHTINPTTIRDTFSPVTRISTAKYNKDRRSQTVSTYRAVI